MKVLKHKIAWHTPSQISIEEAISLLDWNSSYPLDELQGFAIVVPRKYPSEVMFVQTNDYIRVNHLTFPKFLLGRVINYLLHKFFKLLV